jgi:hypothetical protein
VYSCVYEVNEIRILLREKQNESNALLVIFKKTTSFCDKESKKMGLFHSQYRVRVSLACHDPDFASAKTLIRWL